MKQNYIKILKQSFYPSTIFLNTQEKDFKEYITAKNLGEKLCKKTNLLKNNGYIP